MIIRLHTADSDLHGKATPVSAWSAVERIQRMHSESYWLITQPDHARLAGDIAERFVRAIIPHLNPDIITAIRLHDEGWAQFEGDAARPRVPPTNRSGRPLSFLDVSPETFLSAWAGSIRAASGTGPVGEFIVSDHFKILAEYRLRNVTDPPESTDRILDFISREAERQAALLPVTLLSREQLKSLLQLLQFCDLLSLAVCAGAQGRLEFPHDFGSSRIVLSCTGTDYRLDPTPLAAPAELQVPAFQFANGTASAPSQVRIMVR